MRKLLNIVIAFMLLLTPSIQNDEVSNHSPSLVYFGTEVDDGCDNETREDDEPYFVAGNQGNDSNLGTEDCPFATIGKAAESITDGDTVIISHGIYRESVSIEGIDEVTFKAAEGAKVVIDGSRDIEEDLGGEWKEYQNGIYRTNVSQNAWQLFVDLEEMVPARWPNANFTDGSVFNRSLSWAEGSMDRDKYKDEDGNWVYPYENGELIDITGLNESGFDPTGAIAILNVGSFKTWSRNITEFDTENNSFKYDIVPAWKEKHHAYFLEGKLELLDSPGEWFFDNKNNTIYFLPPEGLNPSEANIRAKTQPYGFSSDHGDEVRLENIDFFANTFRFNKCNNCTVDGSHLLYPSTSKRSLNIAGEDTEERWVSRFDGSLGCIVENSVFMYTDGSALEMTDGEHIVRNNYFYFIDWSVSDLRSSMYSIFLGFNDNEFSHNTMHKLGASATLNPGKVSTVSYNDVSDTGHLQTDGAVVQMHEAQQTGSEISYNWIHDTVKYGIRMDGPGLANGDGRNATVHHNVLWNVRGGLMVKGDYHTAHNNTVFGEDHDKNNIIVLFDNEFGNENSTTEFNAADRIAAHRSGTYDDHPVPGTYSDNFNGYEDNGRTFDVSITDDMDFDPDEITVYVGDTITWTNNDGMGHTATSTSGPTSFDSGNIGSGEDWSFTFTEAGIYEYKCDYHSSMTGVIIVIDNSVKSQLIDPDNYDFRPKNNSPIADLGAGAYGPNDDWVAGITWEFMGPELPFEGCMDEDATNYNQLAFFSDGSCIYPPTEGCMDPDAKNYNPDAEVDDGSCEYYVEGCMDPDAKNYNSEAEVDDGSCEYYVEGCTDSNATNYDSEAEVDDGSCEYPEPIEGCMDMNATNYDSEAEVDDGSCEYPEPIKGCMNSTALNYISWAEVEGECLFGPIAIAGQNVTNTPGVSVQFSGAGTDEDGTVEKYEWDFDGDGIFEWSSFENGLTTYIYNNEGTFTATLRVTDNDGFTDTESLTVTIKSPDSDEDGKLNYCPDEITEENEHLVEDSCLATFDDPKDSEKGDEGFLPSLPLLVSICAIVVIALRRR